MSCPLPNPQPDGLGWFELIHPPGGRPQSRQVIDGLSALRAPVEVLRDPPVLVRAQIGVQIPTQVLITVVLHHLS
jgi:hypothetical protein